MFEHLALPNLFRGAAGVVLALCGWVFIAYGWRLYRVLLVAVCVAVGGSIAAWLTRGHGKAIMLAVGLPIGTISGLLAVYFERYGVFLIGGMASAGPILASQAFFSSDHTMYFAALAGFLITGSLGVLFWKPAIVLSMSAIGATLVGRGALLLMVACRPSLGRLVLARYNLAMCLTFLGLVLVGILLQYPGHDPSAPAPET